MTEAQWALFTVLDGCIGTKRHDLYDIMSGLPEEEVSRVWAAYEEARNLYARAARRPKPPTLTSIALQMLDTIERDEHYLPEITDTIRRALEALPDD
jgi:hypothetical protein